MGNSNTALGGNQALKDKLRAIIALESSKLYEKIDSDLITECVDFLMELEGEEQLTKYEIEKKIEEIPFKGKDRTDKKKPSVKVRLLIAAALLFAALVIGGILTVGTSNDKMTLLNDLALVIHSINRDDGSISVGDIEIFNDRRSKRYTVDEFKENKVMQILFPCWLPDGNEIEKIVLSHVNGHDECSLHCTDARYSIGLYIDKPLVLPENSSYIEKTVNSITFYYFSYNGRFQADFEYKGNSYCVFADSEEQLFKIIENLKEIN